MEKPGSCSVLILPEARVRCKTSPAAILNLREKNVQNCKQRGVIPRKLETKVVILLSHHLCRSRLKKKETRSVFS